MENNYFKHGMCDTCHGTKDVYVVGFEGKENYICEECLTKINKQVQEIETQRVRDIEIDNIIKVLTAMSNHCKKHECTNCKLDKICVYQASAWSKETISIVARDLTNPTR